MTSNEEAEAKLKYLFGVSTPFGSIMMGGIISLIVSVALYYSLLLPLAIYVAGDVWGKVFGFFFATGAFSLLMTIPGIQEGKPRHRRVLKFLGDYTKRCLPAGNTWVPPFCDTTEVNFGEQMIDMRDTNVFINNNRKATLHLQLQLQVVDVVKYVSALATLGMPQNPTHGDAVIEAVVAKVKEAVRFVCENFPDYDSLNNKDSKEKITKSVTENNDIKTLFEKWGIDVIGLFVRTVILPADVVRAANLIEIEEREREAETRDVKTLVKIGKIIKDGYKETDSDGKVVEEVAGFGVDGKVLLEAAQLQQKRITAVVTRGGGLNVFDRKGGE